MSRMSENYLKTLAEELSNIISTKTVIGDPIEQGDKVLIPVNKLGFAMGSGSGKGSGDGGTGEGTGGGGGGGLEPVALIAIYRDISGPEGVQVIPLKTPSKLPEVMEKAVETFVQMKEEEKEPTTEKQE